VLGSRLQLNGEPYEVIGVMPPEFRDFWARRAELWAPLAFKPEQFADDRRTNEFLNMIGRLRAGVTVEQAARDMTAARWTFTVRRVYARASSISRDRAFVPLPPLTLLRTLWQ